MEYVDGEYVITNPISDENLRQMKENMDDTDAENFEKFIEKHWKKSLNSQRDTVTVGVPAERKNRIDNEIEEEENQKMIKNKYSRR